MRIWKGWFGLLWNRAKSVGVFVIMGPRSIATMLLVLACAGCATFGGAPLGSADFTKIIPGKTTKNDVVAMLGRPARAHQYRAEQFETWEYPYYGNYEFRVFWIEFLPDGTVRGTNDLKDFDTPVRP